MTALFTEKYGDEVRVVSFGEEEGVSAELCGGTHVDSTAEIGIFRILSEGSVAAGVRRMEVVTGRGAEQLVEERLAALNEAAALLHVKPDRGCAAVKQFLEENQALQKELAQLRQAQAKRARNPCWPRPSTSTASPCWPCRCLHRTWIRCAR